MGNGMRLFNEVYLWLPTYISERKKIHRQYLEVLNVDGRQNIVKSKYL